MRVVYLTLFESSFLPSSSMNHFKISNLFQEDNNRDHLVRFYFCYYDCLYQKQGRGFCLRLDPFQHEMWISPGIMAQKKDTCSTESHMSSKSVNASSHTSQMRNQKLAVGTSIHIYLTGRDDSFGFTLQSWQYLISSFLISPPLLLRSLRCKSCARYRHCSPRCIFHNGNVIIHEGRGPWTYTLILSPPCRIAHDSQVY